jgi:hypothetical protein
VPRGLFSSRHQALVEVESIPSLAANSILRWFSASTWMPKDVITDLCRSTM